MFAKRLDTLRTRLAAGVPEYEVALALLKPGAITEDLHAAYAEDVVIH